MSYASLLLSKPKGSAMKYHAFMLLSLLSSRVLAQGIEPICRQQSQRVYQDCMNGGSSGGGNCPFQTVCEDLCIGGQKTCRVFDCNGLIFSTYTMNCIPQPQTYRCVACYEADELWDSYYQVYKYKYCYKVYNTTNNALQLIDQPCTAYDFDRNYANHRCTTDFSADLRCVLKCN